MKINKPNIVSISIFYLAVVLWSESQCMESDPFFMYQIDNTKIKEHPYNAIVSLECIPSNLLDFPWVGSGFLIEGKFALTAAHVVNKNGKLASDIICRIQRSGLYAENNLLANSFDYPKQYSTGSASHDYALIELAEDVGKYLDNRYILLCDHLKPHHKNHSLRFYGYPGREFNHVDKTADHTDASKLFVGTLCENEEDVIHLNRASYKGMSGGPIMYNDSNLPTKNSIHTEQTNWYAEAILSEGTIIDKDATSNPYPYSTYTSTGCRLTTVKVEHIKNLMKDNKHNNLYHHHHTSKSFSEWAEVFIENVYSGVDKFLDSAVNTILNINK